MKKIKYLFLILLAILILPLGVFAESEDETTSNAEEESAETASKEVKVYFFRGEGCAHCAEAEEWFDSIEEEMGDKFEIVDYETWNNPDNAELMSRVAKVRGEEDSATGVPYIIIGDQSWVGFIEDYSVEMIDKINEVYDQDVAERYDVMTFLEENEGKEEESSTSSDILALIIIILVAGGIGTGVYFTKKEIK